MKPSAFAVIRPLLERLENGVGGLVIDADTHITDLASLHSTTRARYESGPNYYHGRPISAEDLICEMDMAGVDMALCWQNPASTYYPGGEDANADALLEANEYVRNSALRYPNRIIPGGWVDPKNCGLKNARRMVEILITEFGFLFVKMNAAQNRYPIDSPEVQHVVERIVELGAIPAFHFGADTPFTPASGLRRLAEAFPETPILAIHMGGGGAGFVEADPLYSDARELGLQRPNIKYVFSAKRDTHIESDLITYQLAGAPFCHNLFCASDAPYGRMSWNFGGFRLMFQSLLNGARHTDARVRAHPTLFTEEAVQNYLGDNFARFVIGGYRHLLAVHEVAPVACR